MSTGEGPSGQGPRRDQGAEDEQTFADVLNAFSFGKARRARKRSGADATPEAPARREAEDHGPTGPAEPYPQAPPERGQPAGWEPEHDEGQGAASLVRAYTWTGGRTRSHHHFEVETLVTTTELGHRSTAVVQSDHRPVIELCQEPRSVAEVSAMLSVPLGVVKVLLGDMAERGLIVVHESAVTQDGSPDGALMERVLVGLRRI